MEKVIQKKWIRVIGILFACISVMLAGCSDGIDTASETNGAADGKAHVTFSVASDARTIMPTNMTLNNVVKIVLTAEVLDETTGEYKTCAFDGKSEKTWLPLTIDGKNGDVIAVSTAYQNMTADSVALDFGTYNFTLDLYTPTENSNEGRLTQAGTLSKVEVSATTESLAFNTMKYAETGDLNITFVIPTDAEGQSKIDNIDAGLFTVESNGKTAFTATVDDKTVDYGFDGFEDFWADQGLDENHLYTNEDEYGHYGWYTVPNLPNGSYYLKYRLYSGSSITTVTDLVRIHGYKTEKVITIDLDNVNLLFEVLYDTNGGEWINGADEKYSGYERNAYTSVPLPTKDEIARTGYTLDGWTMLDEEGKAVLVTEIVGKDTAKDYFLSAKWTPIQYNYQFDANGGEGSMTGMCVAYDATGSLPKNTFTRTGFDFGGWATSSDGAALYNDEDSITHTLATTQDAVVTLYAVWTEHGSHTIVYKNVDGVTNTNPATFKESEKVTLESVSKTGYTFDGWFEVDKNGEPTGTKVTGWEAGEKTTNVTLYAKLTAITYTITYELAGGINDDANPVSYTIEDYVDLYDPGKDGYTFGGWFTSLDGDGAGIGEAITGWREGDKTEAVTLYAQWTPITYTISFDRYGGDEEGADMDDVNATYDVAFDLPKSTYTKTGYLLAGWKTADSDEVLYTDGQKGLKNLTTTDGGIIALLAEWKPITYTIAFDANGGTGTMESMTATYNADTFLTENTFKRTGYTFEGWSLTKGGEKKYEDRDNAAGASATQGDVVTLYAVWTENKAAVSVTLASLTAAAGTGLSFDEETTTFTANSGFATYLWIIDGTPVSGADSNAYTVDSSLSAGEHNLTLTTKDDNGYHSDTATFTVKK